MMSRLLYLTIGIALAAGCTHKPTQREPSAEACLALFNENPFAHLSDMKSDRIWSYNRSFQHSDKLTYEQPSTTAKDQKSIGSCWIHSYLSMIESQVKMKTSRTYNLSEDFMIFNSLKTQIETALKKGETEIDEGGILEEASALAKDFGIIPEKAWRPKNNYAAGNSGDFLISLINARLHRYNEARQKLKGKELEAEENDARKDLQYLLDYFFGEPPAQFQFDGKTYTPQEFYLDLQAKLNGTPVMTDIYITLSSPMIPMTIKAPGEFSPAGNAVRAKRPLYDLQRIEIEGVDKVIIDKIKEGATVALVIEIDEQFIDSRRGIMSLGAFNVPPAFLPASHRFRKRNSHIKDLHTIHVVGYAQNPVTGKIEKLKVKNSWGKDSGENGYYFLYRDYLETFLDSLTLIEIAKEVEDP